MIIQIFTTNLSWPFYCRAVKLRKFVVMSEGQTSQAPVHCQVWRINLPWVSGDHHRGITNAMDYYMVVVGYRQLCERPELLLFFFTCTSLVAIFLPWVWTWLRLDSCVPSSNTSCGINLCCLCIVYMYSTGTGMRRHLESKHFDGKVICGFESIVFLNQ